MVLHSLYSRKGDEWRDTDINRINYLDEEEPTHCKQRGGYYNMLPLHYAIMNNAPLVVVQRVYNLNKDAIKEVHDDGWTPLHLAAYYDRDEYIPWLKRIYPEAAMEKDADGRTPVELATRYSRLKSMELLSRKVSQPLPAIEGEEKEETAEVSEATEQVDTNTNQSGDEEKKQENIQES